MAGGYPEYKPEPDYPSNYHPMVKDEVVGSYRPMAKDESVGSYRPMAKDDTVGQYSPMVKDELASRPVIGMGGSVAPEPAQRAFGPPKAMVMPSRPKPQERALTAEELMTMANALQAQIEAASQRPSSVEPALERETNVPYWLRAYAEQSDINQGPSKPKQMTKDEAIDNNKYLTAEEKTKYKAYKPK